jgi:hypothetical protein
MKLRRVLVMGAVAVGFSLLPLMAHAQQGMGDYDEHHQWHDSSWWSQHDPNWVHEHHPDWGDYDSHHHWHDRAWWVKHHRKWVEEHHHDWL